MWINRKEYEELCNRLRWLEREVETLKIENSLVLFNSPTFEKTLSLRGAISMILDHLGLRMVYEAERIELEAKE